MRKFKAHCATSAQILQQSRKAQQQMPTTRVVLVLVLVSFLVSLSCVPVTARDPTKQVYEIFVAPEGRDFADGTLSRPLASLAGARNLIRELKVLFIVIFSFEVVHYYIISFLALHLNHSINAFQT